MKFGAIEQERYNIGCYATHSWSIIEVLWPWQWIQVKQLCVCVSTRCDILNSFPVHVWLSQHIWMKGLINGCRTGDVHSLEHLLISPSLLEFARLVLSMDFEFRYCDIKMRHDSSKTPKQNIYHIDMMTGSNTMWNPIANLRHNPSGYRQWKCGLDRINMEIYSDTISGNTNMAQTSIKFQSIVKLGKIHEVVQLCTCPWNRLFL